MGYVYKMMDKDGRILYIGETHDMQSRMSAHFGRNRNASAVPVDEIGCIHSIKYVELESYSDVVVLEAYLIAKHKPQWNRDLVVEGELHFKIDIDHLEWKDWDITYSDNYGHHIFVWKDGELLYEIPKIESVYTPLAKKLGLTSPMNFGYAKPIMDNGYKLMRLSSKRRVKRGNKRQKAKYEFMGYGKWEAIYRQ